jgi:hypothetical protein
MKRNGQLPVLKILNSFSPRSFFFTIPVGGEKSTDPFFKLLDFPGKSVKMS